MKHIQKTILSTADVARLFRVTETTVKRWADGGVVKCQKTPGGHRKFEIRSVVEFAAANGFEPCGALSLAEDDALAPKVQRAVLERDFTGLAEAFVEKALSPERTDLYQFFSYLYEHRFQLFDIYDNILSPGMRSIGERWERGDLGINHEHHASYETLDALAKLQTQILIRPDAGRFALCSCPGDELHEIGLRCAASIFESEGWNVHYLGAQTPVESLVSAIHELKPAVVCVSMTHARPQPRMHTMLAAIQDAAADCAAHVILGGRAVPDNGSRNLPGGTFLSSFGELVQFIHSVPGGHSGSPGHQGLSS